MGLRGPYTLATQGMADWQRKYWWKAVGQIELEISRNPKLYRGKSDLGLDLPGNATGKTVCHRNRKLGDRGGEPGEVVRDYYKTGVLMPGGRG